MKRFIYVVAFTCFIGSLPAQTLPDMGQLVLWLRADSGVVTGLGGDSVTQWKDVSGNLNSTTGPVAPDSLPIWIAHDSMLNNLPTISFNKSLSANNQEFYGTAISALNSSSITIFVVNAGYAMSGSAYTNGLFSVGPYLSGMVLQRFNYSGTYACRFLNNYNASSTVLLAPNNSMPTSGYNYSVWNVEKNLNTSVTLYTNGTADQSSNNTGICGTISPPAGTPYLIGNTPYSGGPFQNLNGKIAEIIVYTTALDSADRQTVLNYLYNKYAPPVNLGPDTVTTSLCPVILNAGNRFVSYSWSTGDNIHSKIAVTQSGSYSVTVTDVFGRISADTINVTVPFKGPSSSDTTICYGASAVLTQLITNPANYTYSWSTGATTQPVTVSSPGKYYGTVSDGTCEVMDTITVKEDSFALRSLLPASAHICGGTSPKLNDAGYTPVSYLWSPGGSTADSIQINSPGTYSVTVTDINHCTASGSSVITIGGHAPVANFSITDVCYTYSTTFTNLSTAVNGDNITSYSWTFPNASPGTSTALSPSAIYNGLGIAYVTLVVASDSGCVDTKTDTFAIHQNPIAQFTGAPGCTANSYQFINQSSTPSGDGVSAWLWNFGDGTTDTSKNPLHQYANNGTFNVSLTVTDSAGCSNTLTQHVSLSQIIPLTQPVPVLPGDNAVFQDTMVFFAWNTVPGATSYTLEIDSDPLFGNPTTITNITATSYTLDSLVQGTTYYWEIIANNLCGGALNSKEDTFSIFNPTALGCLSLWLRGDSVALSGTGVKTWVDKSGNNFSTTGPVQQDSLPTWIAQDPALNNQPAISFNPTTNSDFQEFYGTAIPGIETSSLTTFIVAAGYDCSALPALYREGFFTCGPILSGMWLNRDLNYQYYSFLNNFSASGSIDLNAGYNSLPNTGFNYKLLEMNKNFGVNASIDTNGLEVADTNSSIFAGIFTPGPYLIGNTYNSGIEGFWNLHGKIAEILVYTCALTTAQQQQVQNYIYTRYAPPVYLGADTALHNLCPYTINAGSRFIAYQWSTGDSTHSQISVNQAGAYTVTVTDIFGHTSSSTINVTFPYEGPSPADTTLCYGQSAVLKQLLNNPTSYTYSWNTGSTADSTIATAPGNYIANIFDGTCHLIDTIRVKVDSFPLVTLLQADTLVCGGSSPAINLHGYTPVSYLWSPGGSTSATPALDSAGVYYLTVTDIHGCAARDSISLTFHAHAPVANFSISNFCYGNQTFFTNLDTMFGQDSINSIVWNFPGANPDSAFIPSPVVTYLSVGAEVVTLHITTDSGCTATKTDSLFINKDPQAAFTYTGNNSTLNLAYILCAGNNNYAILTDQSLAGFSSDSLINRVWYINGVIDSGTLSDSIILYPIPNPGTYNVTLVVENEKGCVDTLTQQVQVYAPLNADFSYNNICLSDTTKFLDETHSYSIVTWQWDFGDGSNDNYTQNPMHQYAAPGIYPVSLEVTNAIGCESFTSGNVTVVDTPTANFTGSFACQNELYEPLDSSIAGSGDAVVSWNWVIADSALNTRYPQVPIPAGVSSFQAELVITTMDGCTDSITKNLPVYPSPVAAFTFTPLYGTAPITINFTNSSTGAMSYAWDFGDGSPYNTELDPSHYFAYDSTYIITLDAINSYGCIDSVSRPIQLVPTQLDIAVDTVYVVTLPQSNGTDLVEVIAEVSNQATRLITFAQFKVTLGCGGGTYVQNWTGNLTQGAGMYDTIPVFFDVIPAAANCYVCVTAQDVNNGQTETRYDNNEVCVSLTGTMQLAGPSPNPATTQSTLGIIMPQPGQVSIDIIDELGQYVMNNYTLHLPAGLTNYPIPVPRLNGAEYYIRVTYNSDVEVRKLITR